MRELVLVVDDNYMIREVMLDVLEDAGIAGAACSSAMEGLDLIAKLRPFVVLVDYYLEGPTGADLTHVVRNHVDETLRDTLIIGLSGSHPEAESEFLKAGVNAFARKPFRDVPLIEMVKSMLERARTARV